MSRYFSVKYAGLTPYTPGEQPQMKGYVKLNTNESPFSPSPYAIKAAFTEMKQLELYPDPNCTRLIRSLSEFLRVKTDEIIVTNGSDEALYFTFLAYCDDMHPAVFADVTYGFYKVYAQVTNTAYKEIPLNSDFTIDPTQYYDAKATVFIANPNAPTGIALTVREIETIVSHNTNNVVVIDEAYVDFGAESCLPLICKYDNLIIIRTFSKSRSMAGARLGFAIGNPELIGDLNALRYSTNPYNINRMTLAAGIGSLDDNDYFYHCLDAICENRTSAAKELKDVGFELTESKANFLFARHPQISDKELYEKLKARGVLIRHFDAPRIKDYNRITVGTAEQMNILLKNIRAILEEKDEKR